ncbi:hypothetical protein BGX27_009151 [Mortierella sp. AM989]|nr:hypothetical protein BGX27_009151 [Mortierella sp. AM989]
MRVVLVMGITGAGKSYLIREISGQDAKVGHNLESCTQKIQEVRCQIAGQSVVLLDTPGFDDTNRSDTEVLEGVAEFLEGLYHADFKISGIIYLHNITDVRMRGSSYKNLQMFAKLCGEQSYHNVVMLTGRWGSIDQSLAEERENDLKENFWSKYLKAGCQIDRYRNKDDLIRIFGKIIPQPPVVLAIQREMVTENKSLSETAAGEQVNLHIEEMMKIFQNDLDETTAEYDNQIQQTKNQMDMERLNFQRQLSRLEAERASLMGQRRKYSWMTLSVEDMSISQMDNQGWTMIESTNSSFGRLAQLQYVWCMDVEVVFRGVPPGRYTVQWRVKVTSDTAIVNSEFRAVVLDEGEEAAPENTSDAILFKPQNVQEFTRYTHTEADGIPFRVDFTILELPGELFIVNDFQNVYLQIRNYDW